MYFDVHAHYDDIKFEEDRDELLSSLNEKGVKYIVNSGSSLDTSKESIALSKKYDYIYATVGVHPEEVYDLPQNWIDELEAQLKNDKVLAIGEIGLDYHGENVDKEKQKAAFIEQIKLAKSNNLPVVIHDRDAHGDTLEILKQESVSNGIMHCFAGSVEMAKEIIQMGMFISVGGIVTFKNAKKLVDVVKAVPLENILTETDCPYLAPTPYRGQRNDSSNIKFVVEKIAELKEITVEEAEKTLYNNALKFFGI